MDFLTSFPCVCTQWACMLMTTSAVNVSGPQDTVIYLITRHILQSKLEEKYNSLDFCPPVSVQWSNSHLPSACPQAVLLNNCSPHCFACLMLELKLSLQCTALQWARKKKQEKSSSSYSSNRDRSCFQEEDRQICTCISFIYSIHMSAGS